ncbi:MAG: hypothetical protein KF873_01985 [Gemmataceae bacterium]|nr:hypothetical protein [Gemmataceae bacterium]
MAQYVDKAGETWTVDLDFGLIKQIQKETGVDFAAAMDGRGAGLSELLFAQDPGRLVAVLYVVCEAENKGLSPEEWARRFNGPAIEAASEALIEAVADFFPRSRVGRAIKERLPKAMAAMDERAIRELDARLDQAFSNWATGSPAPPA